MIDDIPHQLLDRFRDDSDMNSLVNDMTTHLQYLAANDAVRSNIVGFWMIDDWYDHPGAAKTALQKMTSLVHQYTPGIPAICGFTGNTGYSSSVSGYARFAANFSPEGCDMVAIYLYPYGSRGQPMTNLTNILGALQNNGWNVNDTRLVAYPRVMARKSAMTFRRPIKLRPKLGISASRARHICFFTISTPVQAPPTKQAYDRGSNKA